MKWWRGCRCGLTLVQGGLSGASVDSGNQVVMSKVLVQRRAGEL